MDEGKQRKTAAHSGEGVIYCVWKIWFLAFRNRRLGGRDWWNEMTSAMSEGH